MSSKCPSSFKISQRLFNLDRMLFVPIKRFFSDLVALSPAGGIGCTSLAKDLLIKMTKSFRQLFFQRCMVYASINFTRSGYELPQQQKFQNYCGPIPGFDWYDSGT